MAATATGPLGTLKLIRVDVVDPDATGEKYLRVRWSLDVTDATEPLVGFYVWHDDEADSTTPVWVDACNAGVVGGGDGGDPVVYEALVPVPLDTDGAIWWESFEEYPLGEVGTMDKGGVKWDGAATCGNNDYGWVGFGEDFESYPTGEFSGDMDAGSGWNGAAVYGDNS